MSNAIGWALLIAVTALVTTSLQALAVPAALLLGPLLSAIGVAAVRPGLAMPHWTVTVGQAAVGCVIAGAMADGITPGIIARWPLFAGIAVATMLLSGGIGYALTRLRVVPGTVAVWGSMPGAAAAMVLMAEADGADARLVAVMVYTRVLVVTMSAAALAAMLGADPTLAARVVPAAALLPTLAVAVAGAMLATVIRWPAGTLIVTMGLGLTVEALGWGRLAMPMPATVAAFALIGWRIGLSFTRDARGAALRMLPRVVLAAIALVVLCGGTALILHVAFGIDPLTAWLATSPGGLESVAIIATSLPVDAPFIMAAQTARFAAVMLVGPAIAAFLARRARPSTAAATR